MANHIEISWIRFGVGGGICASILYPVLLFAPLPLAAVALAAALLGPAIGIGSLGLRQLIQLHVPSAAATIGAICNVAAGALFTSMALVQLAVRHAIPDGAPQEHIVSIWLGLDVAWDVYIGLGTLLFAWSMLGHPRYGRLFAFPGFMLGFLLLGLNFVSFPVPPAEAGSVDVGPFVGLWYFAATLQAWRSITWARERVESPDWRKAIS